MIASSKTYIDHLCGGRFDTLSTVGDDFHKKLVHNTKTLYAVHDKAVNIGNQGDDEEGSDSFRTYLTG